MKAMLEEIEAMIVAGNQRMEKREEVIKAAVLKATDVYSAINMPSVILKKPGKKNLFEKEVKKKKPEQKAEIEILTCKSCGKVTKPGDIFCAGCGLRVEKANLHQTHSVEIPIMCSCGKPWREGTLFCGACGTKKPVVEITDRICPKGHINTPDSGFCFICGEKII